MAPGTDLNRVRQVGVAALEKLQGVLNDPGPFMRVACVDDSRVRVRFYGWVDQTENEFLNVEQRAKKATFDALLDAGARVPFVVVGLVDAENGRPTGGPAEQCDETTAEDRAERLLRQEVAQAAQEESNLLR